MTDLAVEGTAAPAEPRAQPADRARFGTEPAGEHDAPEPATQSPARTALVALREGDAALEAGDAPGAAAHYARAVDASRSAGDAALEARALTRLGDARRAEGDHDRAIAAFNGALRAARQLGVPKAVAAAHRELSLACEAAERFEPALVHFKAFHGLEMERLRADRRQAREALHPGSHQHEATAAFAPSDFMAPGEPAGALANGFAGEREGLASSEEPDEPPIDLPAAPEPEPETGRGEVEIPAEADAAAAEPAVAAPPAEPTVDSLTLLGNATACRRRLAQSMDDPRLDVAMLALDVDHFASVNDTFSDVSGDDVLRRVGLVLLEQLKPGDPAFRVDGDRFHVLLHGPAARTATAVAERLHQAVALHPWHEVARGLAVTVSFGVAVARPGADDAELLEQRARHALRVAKDQGRDRVVVDEP